MLKIITYQFFFFFLPGFNAAVAGCFFAIETVLRPLRAENSPPFTTAMIILASVISSTVSNFLLESKSAFTVPQYDLKSAAGRLSYTHFSFPSALLIHDMCLIHDYVCVNFLIVLYGICVCIYIHISPQRFSQSNYCYRFFFL
jgi:hypothetical protein